MTTTSDFEFDELDELAAAYLDGEATPDEVERVESDPEILARVEEFRGIAETIAEPVELPSKDAQRAAIAAAVAATMTPSLSADAADTSDASDASDISDTSDAGAVDPSDDESGDEFDDESRDGVDSDDDIDDHDHDHADEIVADADERVADDHDDFDDDLDDNLDDEIDITHDLDDHDLDLDDNLDDNLDLDLDEPDLDETELDEVELDETANPRGTLASVPSPPVHPEVSSSDRVTTAPVGSLDAARNRRSGQFGSRLALIGKIAAAIVLVFGGLTVLTQLGDGGSTEVATSVDSASDAAMSESVENASDAADDATEAAMDDTMDDAAMEDDAMEAAEAMAASDSDAATTGAASDAAGDAAASPTEASADESSDNETDDRLADPNAKRYLLPDPTISERADYLGTHASFSDFIENYAQATEGVPPRFLTPDEFNACDLSTLLPSPRAVLYLGTATIDNGQRLVGVEPGGDPSGADRLIIFEQSPDGECGVTLEGLLPR